MSTSLVAEFPFFETSFPDNVATYRVNEATYLCFVTLFVLDATVKRVGVAT